MEQSSPSSENKRASTLGDGVVVLHSTRLDVDESVRTSELTRRLSELESSLSAALLRIAALEEVVDNHEGRILILEGYLGVNGEPTPIPRIILGVWEFKSDGNDFVKSADLNLGVGARNWNERARDTI